MGLVSFWANIHGRWCCTVLCRIHLSKNEYDEFEQSERGNRSPALRFGHRFLLLALGEEKSSCPTLEIS